MIDLLNKIMIPIGIGCFVAAATFFIMTGQPILGAVFTGCSATWIMLSLFDAANAILANLDWLGRIPRPELGEPMAK